MEKFRYCRLSIVVAVIVVILYWALSPRSFLSMKSIALDEFDYLVREDKLNRDLFNGPKIYLDDKYPNYVVFRWEALVDRDTMWLEIFVSAYWYDETLNAGPAGNDSLWMKVR